MSSLNHSNGALPPQRPRPSLRFRDRSAFDGVARRQVGRLDLFAHSVAVLVPSLTALGSGIAFPGMVGPGWWISALLGFGLVWLFAHTFSAFAARFKSAGGLYTFVAKGLGPMAGLLVAGALVVGYSAIIGFGLTDAAGRFDSALTLGGLTGSSDFWRADLLFVAGALVTVLVMNRGVRWASRVTLAVEVVTFVALFAVLGVWMSIYGVPQWDILNLDGASLPRILGGAAVIVVLTLAFESSASLGLETKRPMRDVPVALHSSVVLAGVLFVSASVVSAARPTDALREWGRWFDFGETRSGADALVTAVLGVSLLALAMCVWSALARLIFSLAREGVLPAQLGKVNNRGIPMRAVWAVLPLVVVTPVVTALTGNGVGALSWQLKESAGVALCIAYAATAISLPLLLRAIDEVTWFPVVGALVAAAGAVAVAVAEVSEELRQGEWLAIALLLVSVAVGLLLRWRAGRSTALPDIYVGMHDEALATTVVLAPGDPRPASSDG